MKDLFAILLQLLEKQFFLNQTRPKKRLTLVTSEIDQEEFHFPHTRFPEMSFTKVDPTFPSTLATFANFPDHLGCIAAIIIRQCAVIFVYSTMMTPVARGYSAAEFDVNKVQSGSSLAMEYLFPRDAHKRFPVN